MKIISISIYLSVGDGGETARPGHLVYCFGDIDNKYCRGLSGSAGSDYIMKQIWLQFNGSCVVGH